jgi:hypothetical protein
MPILEQALPGTASSGDHRVFSDFFANNNIVQNVAVAQPKNLLIQSLRDVFRKDSIFTYRDDEFGFPLTPDLSGKPLDTDQSTKILISDIYRYDVKFFPAITIKHNGGSYKPLSFNQEGTYKYRIDYIENEFGARKKISTPTHKVYAGKWEMNLDVSIYCESSSELQELVDITSLALQYVLWNDLRASGLFIQGLTIGGESSEPYANDYIYAQNISLRCLSEWRVEIPLENVIEKIIFYFDSVRTESGNPDSSANSTVLRYSDILELTKI